MEFLKKVYVEVIARFNKDGTIFPLSLTWVDGTVYEITKIKDIRPAASYKTGGVGIRYVCLIGGKEANLFLEENKWFVEGKN